MRNQSIPSPVVWRLSLYLRQLEHLAGKGIVKVSSRSLADTLQATDAQVRKDLAHFGQFGRPGVGYRVEELIARLRHILRTDRLWNVAVVGAGDVGRALVRHKAFRRKGFDLVAIFDVADHVVGTTVGGLTVRHLRELSGLANKLDIRLAVVAVPPESAQAVTDQLCQAGIRGILNFAPTTLQTPAKVTVRQVDLAAQLEQLSFHVGTEGQ
jgi:redox-sensing transcriptional repressor